VSSRLAIMKTAIQILLVLVFSMLSTLASADNKTAIVGKWAFEEAGMTGSIELSANGKVVMDAKKASMKRGAHGEGTYKWIDDKTIEMSVVFDRAPKQVTFSIVKLEPKTLTITDDRGDTKTFKRVR